MIPIVCSVIVIELWKVIMVRIERQKDKEGEKFSICYVLPSERLLIYGKKTLKINIDGTILADTLPIHHEGSYETCVSKLSHQHLTRLLRQRYRYRNSHCSFQTSCICTISFDLHNSYLM